MQKKREAGASLVWITLAAGVDLDQRLVGLRRERLALARLARRRRVGRGCFLGGAQFVRVGLGQRQSGGVEQGVEIGLGLLGGRGRSGGDRRRGGSGSW